MLKTADFKTCAQIQPKRGWCFVRKLFLCVFFCLFPIFSFATTLPSGYTQLEYIQSGGKQWIEDTTLKNTFNTGAVEITVDLSTGGGRFVGWTPTGNTTSDRYTVFGALAKGSASSKDVPMCYSNYQQWNDNFNNNIDYAKVNVLKYEFTSGAQKLYVNGDFNKESTFTANPTATNYTFKLFTIHKDDGYDAYVRIHDCKVYEGNTLVRHYIPVKNSNDELGMYELLTDRFLTNAGTGTFTAGPVVETYTELEYIDIPANTGFNTNVYLNGNMDIEYEVMIVQRVSVGMFGGARSEKSYGAGFNFPYNYNNSGATNMLVDFFGSQNSNGRWTIQRNGSTYVPEANKKYKLSIINKVGTFSVDGTVIDTHTYVADGIPNTVPYVIHASYNVDTFYYEYEDTIRFYHFSASGAADIVPAQRDSDGELGLYNKTTGEFLEKIGSGTLVAGPAVAQPATVEIIWDGLSEPDASGMCTYGETFTAPSIAPTAPSGLKFLGWIPR